VLEAAWPSSGGLVLVPEAEEVLHHVAQKLCCRGFGPCRGSHFPDVELVEDHGPVGEVSGVGYNGCWAETASVMDRIWVGCCSGRWLGKASPIGAVVLLLGWISLGCRPA